MHTDSNISWHKQEHGKDEVGYSKDMTIKTIVNVFTIKMIEGVRVIKEIKKKAKVGMMKSKAND